MALTLQVIVYHTVLVKIQEQHIALGGTFPSVPVGIVVI